MQCPECGKRALNIATRCPHCGKEFVTRPPPVPTPAPELRRFGTPLAMVAAAIAVVAIGIAVIRRNREPEPAATVTATRPETAVAAEPPPETIDERRFARTWTKVRTRRSTSAEVAAVLLPGDTVLVDSLVRGWWRVTLEGKVLGYAHRSTLDTEPRSP